MAHIKSHYRYVDGKPVYVPEHDDSRPHGREAELHERTAIGRHKSGTHYLRATDAEDGRAIEQAAQSLGHSFTKKRAGATHHGRTGAYDHYHFEDPAHAAAVHAHLKQHGNASAGGNPPKARPEQPAKPEHEAHADEAWEHSKNAFMSAQSDAEYKDLHGKAYEAHTKAARSKLLAGEFMEAGRHHEKALHHAERHGAAPGEVAKIASDHARTYGQIAGNMAEAKQNTEKWHDGASSAHLGAVMAHARARDAHRSAAEYYDLKGDASAAREHQHESTKHHEAVKFWNDGMADVHKSLKQLQEQGQQAESAQPEQHMPNGDAQAVQEGKVLTGQAAPKDLVEHKMHAERLSAEADRAGTKEAHEKAAQAHAAAADAARKAGVSESNPGLQKFHAAAKRHTEAAGAQAQEPAPATTSAPAPASSGAVLRTYDDHKAFASESSKAAHKASMDVNDTEGHRAASKAHHQASWAHYNAAKHAKKEGTRAMHQALSDHHDDLRDMHTQSLRVGKAHPGIKPKVATAMAPNADNVKDEDLDSAIKAHEAAYAAHVEAMDAPEHSGSDRHHHSNVADMHAQDLQGLRDRKANMKQRPTVGQKQYHEGEAEADAMQATQHAKSAGEGHHHLSAKAEDATYEAHEKGTAESHLAAAKAHKNAATYHDGAATHRNANHEAHYKAQDAHKGLQALHEQKAKELQGTR